MHVRWKFMLASSPSVGAPVGTQPVMLGELTQARSKQFTVALNKSGNASFTVPVQGDLEDQIKTLRTCLVIVRNGTPVWSGPIVGINGALPDDKMTINAVGWLDLLQNRELHVQKPYNPTTHTPAGVEWKNHEVALDVLNHINTQMPGYNSSIGPGVVSAAPATYTYPDYQNTFEIGAKAEQIITDMSELEDGYDWSIDPMTLRLNIKHWASYTDRPNVHFGYRRGPFNLARFEFTEDALKTRNRMTAMGAGVGPALAEDTVSQGINGVHEESVSLPEVQKLDALQGHVGAEVAVRSYPEIIYNITPFPAAHTNDDQVPRFMEDYFIGDKIYLSASRGSRVNLSKQAIRLFALTMSIDEEGNERVQNMTTSLSGT